ncbi:unnamed protein product [Owenia fusiformis]|uniref:Uncharacterized protein n=1 Tax=Owenia fusiformis TaxID=6347 RepID=A0A8S4Q5B3_OWEFU|nr:unnamed protein product [Owenia fusiformis]
MSKLKVLFAMSSIMLILLVYGIYHLTESDIMPKLSIYKDKFRHILDNDGVNRERTTTPLKEVAKTLLPSDSARKNRKHLLFSHFPKAGGSEIKYILGMVVGGRKNIYGGNGGNKDYYVRRFKANSSIFFRTNYFYQNEGQSMDPDLKSAFFVIGHVRSPCNYLLSCWTYGSSGKGDVYKMTKDKSVYGKIPPFNNTDDLERLTMWLQDNKKIYTNRLIYKYFKTTHWKTDLSLKNVDCWVHTEMLIYDLVNCLKRYEKQGGNVKWENFHKIKKLKANPSNHSQCKNYFDDERTALVMDSNKDMAKIFGYENCCTESNTTLPADIEELWNES